MSHKKEEMPVTYSTIAATVSSGCHILKVSGYSQAKLLIGTGKYIASAKFEAAGHSWRIVVYPNGHCEECAPGCIWPGLMLDEGESKDVRACFRFSLVRHGSKLTGKPHGGKKIAEPVILIQEQKGSQRLAQCREGGIAGRDCSVHQRRRHPHPVRHYRIQQASRCQTKTIWSWGDDGSASLRFSRSAAASAAFRFDDRRYGEHRDSRRESQRLLPNQAALKEQHVYRVR